MTIHSDWSRLFHEECPAAFTARPAVTHPQVGIIDGHLQLMCLHKSLPSWDAFLRYLFLKPILQLYEAGCPRVVLCFDAYEHVPSYKSMTQTKRTQQKPVAVFHAAQDLPATIPVDPMLYLMNRHFKLKLVDMICKRLPALLFSSLSPVPSSPPREFILDYKRVLIFTEGQDPSYAPFLDGMNPMGESDVKFCRYVTKYGNALVHAIDGDYLAIALLYYTTRSSHSLASINEIHIYRQLSSFSPAPRPKGPQSARKVRKCWVNVPLLYVSMLQAARQVFCPVVELLNVHTGSPFQDTDMIRAMVFLMLLAGTDFSRPLPWLGPRRLWDHLHEILPSLVQAVASPPAVMLPMAADLVVAKLYKTVFSKHCRLSSKGLTQVMLSLQDSDLSGSVRAKFPSTLQVDATLRNVAWVMEYWMTHNALISTPLDGTHGFSCSAHTQRIIFHDLQ